MMDLSALTRTVRKLPRGKALGRITKVVGLIVESRGPEGSVGEQMKIHLGDGRDRIRCRNRRRHPSARDWRATSQAFPAGV